MRDVLKAVFEFLTSGIVGFMSIVVGLVLSALIAVLVWWVSELAYEVHWVLGAPVRIVAFILVVSVVLATIGTALTVLLTLIAIVIAVPVAIARKIVVGRTNQPQSETQHAVNRSDNPYTPEMEYPYTPEMIAPIREYDSYFMWLYRADVEYSKVLLMLNERGHITNETPRKVLDFLERAFTHGGILMAHAMRWSYHDSNEWHGGLDAVPKTEQLNHRDDIMAVMRLMRSGVWEIGLGLPAGFADSSPVSVRNLALYDLNFIVANELHAQFSEMFREQAESLIAENPQYVSKPWYESIDVEHAMFELVLSAYTAGALFMANAARTSFTKANSGMWEKDFDAAAKNGRGVLDTNA